MGVVRSRRLFIIAVALFVAACGGQTTDELRSSQSTLGAVGSYVLNFNGRVPAGMAAQVAALGGAVDFTHPAGFVIVSGVNEADANTLGANSVLPDVELMMDDVTTDAVLGAGAVPQSPGAPSTAYFYGRQWNMRAISADAAWANGRLGSPNVTVAILDTGIDYTYPDLAGRVDLSRSASFVPTDDAYAAYYFPGKHPVTDLHYHGTHVAATVASNGYVAAGVTSQTTLIGVKVCSWLGGCPFSSIVQGVLHAVDNGADVINMSLGGAFTKSHNGAYVGFINKLFNAAHAAGVTVVVAAGNAAADLQHNGNTYATYCDSPHTICVSATAPLASGGTYGPWYSVDTPTSYTNYGTSAITVAAPGGGSAGWVWAACSQTSLKYLICGTGYYILGAAGTSMASPHVAGLAALVVEDVGRNPGQVRAAITKGADDLGTQGADPYFGKGRINVVQSLK